MKLLERLGEIWQGSEQPFLFYRDAALRFSQVVSHTWRRPLGRQAGDVVALIGDFDPPSILALLHLIDLGAIVVPLTVETAPEHEYFFESAAVDVVIANGVAVRRQHVPPIH